MGPANSLGIFAPSMIGGTASASVATSIVEHAARIDFIFAYPPGSCRGDLSLPRGSSVAIVSKARQQQCQVAQINDAVMVDVRDAVARTAEVRKQQRQIAQADLTIVVQVRIDATAVAARVWAAGRRDRV